jgi:dienelactone hydrolase
MTFRAALDDLLASAAWRVADAGEVHATAQRIADGSSAGWVSQWTRTATRARELADEAAAHGRRVSAREAYLRASTYFATAAAHAPHERARPLWDEQRECWDRAVPLFDPPGEPFDIPYEGTTLPGWLFRAPGSEGRRPLVILNNGTRETTAAMLVRGGAAANARGHHWMTFDGPGQNAALLRQGIALRPDWERVVTPVLDRATRFPGVDRARVALIGTGTGGFLVARAAAFEKRLAATVADPGIWELRAPLLGLLDQRLFALLAAGDRERFDDRADRLPASLEAALRPLGIESPYDAFAALEAYTLEGVAERITTPLLLTESEHDPWPNHARRVYDAARGPKAFARFTAYEGAGARWRGLAVREQRIFDWIETMLAV